MTVDYIKDFTSSAATNIGFDKDENVVITRPNGVDYSYSCADTDAFITDINAVIDASESVGKFLDRSIKSNVLVEIAQ